MAFESLASGGLSLALPGALDPREAFCLLCFRNASVLDSDRAPAAVELLPTHLITTRLVVHENAIEANPTDDVGWPRGLRFSELTGHDGRLAPAAALRAIAGPYLHHAWRHSPGGQFQVIMPTRCFVHGGVREFGWTQPSRLMRRGCHNERRLFSAGAHEGAKKRTKEGR